MTIKTLDLLKLDLLKENEGFKILNKESIEIVNILQETVSDEVRCIDVLQETNSDPVATPFPDDFTCYCQLYSYAKSKIDNQIEAERRDDGSFRVVIPPILTENLQGKNYIVLTVENSDSSIVSREVIELNVLNF
jgi:uncharacterized Fe-S cluster-containing protein